MSSIILLFSGTTSSTMTSVGAARVNYHLFDTSFGSEEPSHIFILSLDGTEVNGQWMHSGCGIPF
jgi:hypothetical protein